MRTLAFIIIGLSIASVSAQPNCWAYLHYGDTLKYEACNKAEEIQGYYQFSKEYQSLLDESLMIDPTFDYAYWAKSIAYLKSGDFVTWKKLIDKAVDNNPKEHLGYRGWCRYQFFRDYKGAIEDIDKLDSLVDYDIGQSQNGTYHLNIAKGLCYKAIGEKEKALEILKAQINLDEPKDYVGPYDYFHLGVLYYETKKYRKAIEFFKKQSEKNEIADNRYYSALTFFNLDNLDEYKSCLEKTKELYIEGSRLSDPYSNPMDKIFLVNIEEELKTAYAKGD